MDLSKVIAAVALALAAVLVSEYSRAAEKQKARETTTEAREAAQRLAVVEHQRRKDNVARLCGKSLMTQAEMEACRAAYRRL